jgi:hypothetical protein
MVMQCIGITLRSVLSMGGGTMKTLSGTSELVEKERMRLQINTQVEEFLRRGGAIEVVNGTAKPATADVRSVREDLEESTLLYD